MITESCLIGTHLMETRKVHVSKDDMALLECPYCRSSRIVNAAKYRNRKDPLKVKCICRKTFNVAFEWRGARRKETYLDGYYSKLPARKDWNRMRVKDLSETGVGFTTLTTHDLKEGDKVKVKFRKDDGKYSEVEKIAIVRRVLKDNNVGCEFGDPA
jgi:predicted DNA-binding antitoxin AbrB/MazE fold protein